MDTPNLTGGYWTRGVVNTQDIPQNESVCILCRQWQAPLPTDYSEVWSMKEGCLVNCGTSGVEAGSSIHKIRRGIAWEEENRKLEEMQRRLGMECACSDLLAPAWWDVLLLLRSQDRWVLACLRRGLSVPLLATGFPSGHGDFQSSLLVFCLEVSPD